ncbi:MAG: MoaD/ThiS family protein [Pseudomonadota bacterium]
MALTVVYFGKLMDAAGCSEEHIALPDGIADSEALRGWLDTARNMHGALLAPTVRIAVNDAIAKAPLPIRDGDEIAFMPPVGGG